MPDDDTHAYAKSLLREIYERIDEAQPDVIRMIAQSDGQPAEQGVSHAVHIGANIRPLDFLLFCQSVAYMCASAIQSRYGDFVCESEIAFRTLGAFSDGITHWWHDQTNRQREDRRMGE